MKFSNINEKAKQLLDQPLSNTYFVITSVLLALMIFFAILIGSPLAIGAVVAIGIFDAYVIRREIARRD